MASFSEEIKSEILETGFRETSFLIALSALLQTCGTVFRCDGGFGFEISTENEEVADYFQYHLKNMGYEVSPLLKKEKSFGHEAYYFQCKGEKAQSFLSEYHILIKENDDYSLNLGIDFSLLSDNDSVETYIKGAFLGSGSCTLPESKTTGFHIEFVFSNKILAEDFCELLLVFEVFAKLIIRKETFVVYAKSKEVISDILFILVKGPCLEKFRRIEDERDEQNTVNRLGNCSVSNIDKTLTASVKQFRAIQTIRETKGLKTLPESLFCVAMCRLADPNASLQELADRLHISKSCLNHRMRKIIDIASTLS